MSAQLRYPLSAALAAMCTFALTVCAAEMSATKSDTGVAIKVDGQPFTEYVFRSGSKPIIWPIIGPSGKPMTRSYPMSKVEGEKTDHIHHRSLWFTHGTVNGVDFWLEGPTGGITKQRDVKVEESKQQVRISTHNDWNSPEGKKILEDERVVTFGAEQDYRWIDFDITLKASEGPVTFGDTKEGTFGIRVPQTVSVEAKKGGRIVNSEGQIDGAAWGKPAAWVDYFGPADENAVNNAADKKDSGKDDIIGIAILNHPKSFRAPTHWHVRTYGLFAANPFGIHDFEKKGKGAGDHTIDAGKSITLRYRVIFHNGDDKQARIAELYSAYAKQAPIELK